MATKETLLKDLDWVTEKISSEVWTLNLGVMGTTWALLIASNNVPYAIRLQIVSAAPILIFSLLSIVAEFLQHLSAYINNRLILRMLEKAGRTDFKYENKAFFYRCRIFFFYAKIICTLTSAGWLLKTLYFGFSS